MRVPFLLSGRFQRETKRPQTERPLAQSRVTPLGSSRSGSPRSTRPRDARTDHGAGVRRRPSANCGGCVSFQKPVKDKQGCPKTPQNKKYWVSGFLFVWALGPDLFQQTLPEAALGVRKCIADRVTRFLAGGTKRIYLE